MNVDKKLRSDYEERSAEINYIYIYPSIVATTTLFYLIRKARRNKVETKAKI